MAIGVFTGRGTQKARQGACETPWRWHACAIGKSSSALQGPMAPLACNTPEAIGHRVRRVNAGQATARLPSAPHLPVTHQEGRPGSNSRTPASTASQVLATTRPTTARRMWMPFNTAAGIPPELWSGGIGARSGRTAYTRTALPPCRCTRRRCALRLLGVLAGEPRWLGLLVVPGGEVSLRQVTEPWQSPSATKPYPMPRMCTSQQPRGCRCSQLHCHLRRAV